MESFENPSPGRPEGAVGEPAPRTDLAAPRTDLAALRTEYAAGGLVEEATDADPLVVFRRWLDDAIDGAVSEPNAMVVATVSAHGVPSARTVLLKAFDEDGFVFFTNTASRKGVDLAVRPTCALLFPWHAIHRQVRVTGTAELLEPAEVHAYFASRPRGAQLGAWASQQSSVVASRSELEAAYADAEARFAEGDVPVPPTWGGYRVTPQRVEFWQGRESRLHDRLEYVRGGDGGWERRRLAP